MYGCVLCVLYICVSMYVWCVSLCVCVCVYECVSLCVSVHAVCVCVCFYVSILDLQTKVAFPVSVSAETRSRSSSPWGYRVFGVLSKEASHAVGFFLGYPG